MKENKIYTLRFVFMVFLLVGMIGCDFEKACPLSDGLKNRIVRVNKLYGEYVEVESIPCEHIYVNLNLRSDSVPDSIIYNTHKILYSEAKGWMEIQVYNKQGNYLYKRFHEHSIEKAKELDSIARESYKK